MSTQIEFARQGVITAQMEEVARNEGLETEFVRRMVAEGKLGRKAGQGFYDWSEA